ncbi:MAG: hypothetical protein QOI76_3222 [Frankiales bacterium]|nr:hypothetical protein [Frankiales bacterium]
MIPRGHRRGVALLASFSGLVYSVFSVARHHVFETTAYDLGIFFEAVRGWAHLGLPIVPVKGVHDQLGTHFDLLGDHFHPILALLAPTYWIWPHPETLLVDQALLFAVSAVPVWAFVQRLLGPRAAYLWTTGYVTYWGLQEAAAFDFHEIAFAVPLIAFAIERVQARRFPAATIAVLMLLLVKEDLALLVAFFGLYIAVRGRRVLGSAVTAAGVVGYVLITRVFLPHFAGGQAFMYWTYDSLGKDLPSALGFMARHPLRTVQLFFTPAVKWHTLLWIFAPFALLTAGSSTLILLVPLLAERFFSSGPQYWVTGYHYTATAAPIVAMGAAEGLHRILRLVPKDSVRAAAGRWVPAAVAVAGLASIAYFPLHELFLSRLWATGGRVAAAHAAVAQVPRGVTVEATDRLQPHLVDHTNALLLDGTETTATWLVADVGKPDWPLKSVDKQQAYVARREAEGWTVVFNRDGFVVLHGPS